MEPSSKATPSHLKDGEILSSTSDALVLGQLLERFKSLEEKVTNSRNPPQDISAHTIEIAKIVFSGWPAFGLIFLFLFYTPIKSALNAIPEKVKQAEQIEVAGISLRSALKAEAKRTGLQDLATLLPSLSSGAITKLLSSENRNNTILSYGRYDSEIGIDNIAFPNKADFLALKELEKNGLIKFSTYDAASKSIKDESVESIQRYLEQFKHAHPGKEEPVDFGTPQTSWRLKTPLNSHANEMFHPTWSLTETGKKASEIITNSVAKSLANEPDHAEKK